uniref:protein-tyrosine-phosphatase n=1 Tax=Cynoglossus semilaevis TaxID=244447 RepID=A0A3P8WRB4_CYNSE
TTEGVTAANSGTTEGVTAADSGTTEGVTAAALGTTEVRTRGSNLSLLLDVSALGVETVSSVSTPKEVWLQLLHTSSRPLTKEQLRQAAEDTNTLNAEYQKIPTNFVSAAELDVPGHAIKDRYKTILPNPETRVVLQNLDEKSEAGPVRYINANYIRGPRGPTSPPRARWEEKSSIIVMVTRLKENNEKCEAYWPEVTNQFEHRPIRHYWFTSWPDHHIPKCTAPLLLMVEEVETYRKSLLSPDSQPGAESAGIGRTGCFIASSIGVQQLRDTDQADIQETTPEQYQFLYSTLAQFSSQLQEEQRSHCSCCQTGALTGQPL